QNCSECKEKRAAHILCTYCNRWLCSSCTEEHRHGPAPGDPLFPRAQKRSPGVNGGSGDFALYCPLHTQEVLKLFCETCDVLTCHSCLMVEHKEHRCRHLEEVLQNQRMLLESVTTQVAHKKSNLQTSAKQIEDRIFEVKHQHRKVENQIKMAKMVLINELNKQANGLIEELEGITNERKQKLEQQLQSIMVLNRQFEHVQNFINWAVCSKTSVPFLFSKELIVFQMQRLLETSCNTDPGSPWSIRFTWEPNFWTKQLASLAYWVGQCMPKRRHSLRLPVVMESSSKPPFFLVVGGRAQQPSLQLSQTKSPQHLQQTIVGQINYIVRQPAPVQSQSQPCMQPPILEPAMFETYPGSYFLLQATDEPPAPEGPKLPLHIQTLAYFPSQNSPTEVSQATSPSLQSFLSSDLDWQWQDTSLESKNIVGKNHSPIPSPPSNVCECVYTSGQMVGSPSFSLSLPVPASLCYSLATSLVIMGFSDTLEMEVSSPRLTRTLEPQIQSVSSLTAGPPQAVPSPLSGHPQTMSSLTIPLLSSSQSQVGKVPTETQGCFCSHRPFNNEPKIPYVRLERLKICAASSGEMPVFKLKPQKNDQVSPQVSQQALGAVLQLLRLTSSPRSARTACLMPSNPQVWGEESSLAGQRPPEVEDASSEEHRLIPRTPGAKKGPPAPIENEDFCAVCLNGGELLCCDRCPKVYHLSCHVPALLSFPGGEWVCTLCRSLTQPEMEYDCENARYNQPAVRAPPGLSMYDQKKCEKLVLSLCCNSLSLPFHEPVSPLEARHYYQIIKRPMDLSIIRRKLQKKDPAHYTTPEELVSDVRLMFWNCAKFNYPDSEVAEAGRCLEVFFEGWLKEIYPDKRF
uniref:Tripartite motif-containing protein 66 n=1 Tax=Loxodonta africana TaxID=9785 RepID=G3UHS7_LOXAF